MVLNTTASANSRIQAAECLVNMLAHSECGVYTHGALQGVILWGQFRDELLTDQHIILKSCIARVAMHLLCKVYFTYLSMSHIRAGNRACLSYVQEWVQCGLSHRAHKVLCRVRPLQHLSNLLVSSRRCFVLHHRHAETDIWKPALAAWQPCAQIRGTGLSFSKAICCELPQTCLDHRHQDSSCGNSWNFSCGGFAELQNPLFRLLTQV